MNFMTFLSEIARASGDRPQHVGQVVEAIDEQMADAVLALEDAVGDEGGGSSGDGAEPFPGVNVDDQVRRAGLILQRHERDPFRRRGTLSQQDEARDAVAAFGFDMGESGVRRHATAFEFGAEKLKRMAVQRQPRRLVVGDHILNGRH